MSPVDLGISYDEAEKESGFEPLPVKDYDFQITEANPDETSKGRPMLVWRLEVINDPELHGRSWLYNTPLPWTDPETQQFTSKGIGLLYALCEGVGRPWEGSNLDENSMIGLQGKLRNSHRGYCSTCQTGGGKPGSKCSGCGGELEARDNVKKIYTR